MISLKILVVALPGLANVPGVCPEFFVSGQDQPGQEALEALEACCGPSFQCWSCSTLGLTRTPGAQITCLFCTLNTQLNSNSKITTIINSKTII